MIDLLQAYKRQCSPARLSKKARTIKASKVFIVLIGVFFLTLFLSTLQHQATKVSADALPTEASPEHIDFGLVFPGEEISHYFTIKITGDNKDPITYTIKQYPKPLPEFLDPQNPDSARQYCRNNPNDYEKCYPDLCAYLKKEIVDTGENDTELKGLISLEDPEDLWEVKLDVPPIEGNVSQSYKGSPVKTKGEYGCDIAIDIEKVPPPPGDGEGGDGEPEPDSTTSLKDKVIAPVTEVIPLPAVLPRVGAWSVLILASAGLVWEIIVYRRRKK